MVDYIPKNNIWNNIVDTAYKYQDVLTTIKQLNKTQSQLSNKLHKQLNSLFKEITQKIYNYCQNNTDVPIGYMESQCRRDNIPIHFIAKPYCNSIENNSIKKNSMKYTYKLHIVVGDDSFYQSELHQCGYQTNIDNYIMLDLVVI
jgi:hypothetical protein